jgi:hypothetical protein
MAGNWNPCTEFSKCWIHLCEVREVAAELTYTKLATWRLLPAPCCKVHAGQISAESGHPLGLLSFTDPSWCHFDIHNCKEFWLGALCLWNSCQKPCCIVVMDSVLITPCLHACYTDQCSMSTKLQVSLYTTTVNMEAVLRGYPCFQISKTVRCFWCTCIWKKIYHYKVTNYCFMLTQYKSFFEAFFWRFPHHCRPKHSEHLLPKYIINSRNQQILMSCNKDSN